MFEFMLNRLSTHAQFSILMGMAFGIVAVIVALIFGMSLAAIPAFAFLISAGLYLILDFYEHFGAGE